MPNTFVTNLPTIYKRNADGSVQQWTIGVIPEDNGTATILTLYGRVGGEIIESRDVISQGKNPGKKNATTPLQQAINEATAEHTKKLTRKHYGYTVEESDNKKLIAPMLALVYEDHMDKVQWGGEVFVQPKFDGHRCLTFCDASHNITMLSREGDKIESCPHIAEALASVMQPGMTIDGELYIHNESLNKIGSLVRKSQPESVNLRYIVYDTINTQLAFRQRYDIVQRLIDPSRIEVVHAARTQEVKTLDAAMEFQAQCLEHNYEGAMIRHGVGGYAPGKRSSQLLKLKTFVDAEFTITEVKHGRGAYADAAVFTCLTPDGNPFDVTAPGSMEEKRKAWTDRDSMLGRRIVVKYMYYTKTDKPVPFLPVAKCYVERN